MTRSADQSLANKELVRQHIDLSWNEADLDGLDRVWAADAVVHLYDGQILHGLHALKEHLRSVVLVWDERLCEIQELVAEGDTVANRWTFRGTAGGQRVTIVGMDFYRVADGRIVEEWIALGATDSAPL